MSQILIVNYSKRILRIYKADDLLVELNQVANWEQPRELVERVHEKPQFGYCS